MRFKFPQKSLRGLSLFPALVIFSLAAGGAYLAIQIYLFRTFQYSAYDLALHDQAIWLLSKGLSPFSTIKGVPIFGDHLSFHSVLVAVLMGVWNSTEVLFVFAVSAWVITAWILYFAARTCLSPIWSFVVAFTYFFHPANSNMIVEAFHPEVSVSVPLAFMFWSFLRNSQVGIFAGAFLALIAKEDIAISIASFSLFWLGYAKKRGRNLYAPIILFVFSLGYFFFATRFVMPIWFMGLSSAQKSLSSAWFRDVSFLNFVNGSLISGLLTQQTFTYLFLLFTPFLLGLWGALPSALVLVGPAFLVNVLSKNRYLVSIDFHYNYVTLPFCALVMILGLRKLSLKPFWALASILGVLVWHEAFSQFKYTQPNRMIALHRAASIETTRKKIQYLHSISDQEAISAHYRAVPFLAHRKNIFMFPNPFMCDRDLWNMWYQACKDTRQGKSIDRLILNGAPEDSRFSQLVQFLKDSERFQTSRFLDYEILEKRKDQESKRNVVRFKTQNGKMFYGDTLQHPFNKWVLKSVWGDEILEHGILEVTARIRGLKDLNDIQIDSPQLMSAKVAQRGNHFNLEIKLDLDRAGQKGLLVKDRRGTSEQWLSDRVLEPL